MKQILSRFSLAYQAFIIFLALLSIGMVIFETTYQSSLYNNVPLIIAIDVSIAVIFLIDFIIGWYRSEDKKIFWKQRWWELFACIPFTTPITQSLRGIGILRLLRIVQVLSRLKRMHTWMQTLSYKVFSLSITTCAAIVISASIFYSFEHKTNASVTSYADSLWWTISTITTTGYGDIIPTTLMGRIIGMILMLSGVVIFGVLVNYITSHYRLKK
jgi:voltage-gated potassium channel